MSQQRNDILLISGAAAILVTSLVAGFIWIRPLAATAGGKTPPAAPSGESYVSLITEDNLGFRSSWTRPEDNEDGWTYDLFDAVPTVWDEQLKEYLPRDYTPPVIPDFGIKLVKVGHPRYPLIVRGTLPSPRGEAERIFFLENIDTKQSYDARLNRPVADIGVTPVSFKVVNATDASGAPVRRNVLTIKDSKLSQTLEIDDLAPLEFKDKIDIVLKADAGEPVWTFHAVGATFEHNGSRYTVKGVDLSAGTVTVDKTFTLNPRKGPRTLTETLSVAGISVPPAVGTPAPATTPATPPTGFPLTLPNPSPTGTPNLTQ